MTLNSAEALVVIAAYEHQSHLSKWQRDLLAHARKVVWNHANELLGRENPASVTTCM